MIVEENIVIRTVARRCDPLPTPAKIFFKISECGTELKVIVIAKIWRVYENIHEKFNE
jgi:hypothetical protein